MDNKADRRKTALRENLKRRKAQMREQNVRKEETPRTSVRENISSDKDIIDDVERDAESQS